MIFDRVPARHSSTSMRSLKLNTMTMPEKTCYNCGRQFMKKKSSFLNLRKHHRRCPKCNSEFDHDSSNDDAIRDRNRRLFSKRSFSSGLRFSSSFSIRSLLSIASRKGGYHPDQTKTTVSNKISNCSTDEVESENVRVNKFKGSRNNEELVKVQVTDEKNLSLADSDGDPCSFAFTYENESLDPNKMHSPNHENVTLADEYQLDWLL